MSKGALTTFSSRSFTISSLTFRSITHFDVVCIYNGILLSHKRNEMMPFAAVQTDLDLSQRQVSYHINYVWNLKNDTDDLICKTEIDSQT